MGGKKTKSERGFTCQSCCRAAGRIPTSVKITDKNEVDEGAITIFYGDNAWLSPWLRAKEGRVVQSPGWLKIRQEYKRVDRVRNIMSEKQALVPGFAGQSFAEQSFQCFSIVMLYVWHHDALSRSQALSYVL